MKADDELCFCFHVSWRKVIRFIERNRVSKPSQVSECHGAGTGCGWCRRQITRLLDDVKDRSPGDQDLDAWLSERTPSQQSHADGRQRYLKEREAESHDS
jgi:bacterioferritin-associated ferredoxin